MLQRISLKKKILASFFIIALLVFLIMPFPGDLNIYDPKTSIVDIFRPLRSGQKFFVPPKDLPPVVNVQAVKPTINTEVKEKQHYPIQCRNRFTISKSIHLDEKYDEVVISRHPNLPNFLTNSTFMSSAIPEIHRIRWSGIVYQESWKESPKFLLYSAHFDSRSKSGLVIRLLSLYDGYKKLNNSGQFYCQFYFNEVDKPVVNPVTKIDYITHIERSKVYDLNPYGITCQVPQVQNGSQVLKVRNGNQVQNGSQVPIAVSLVKNPCEKTSNILKIFGSPLLKKRKKLKSPTIGICGKALFYYNEDFSRRLVEWIEIMRILGVSKIFLYKTTCNKNIERVLDFYEKSGFVKLVTFYYPPPYVQDGTFIRLWTQLQKNAYRKAQMIYLNDCILRNKYDFDYLGVFDSDEIPILRKHKTLQDFIKFSYRTFKPFNSFNLKWKVFYEDLSPGTSALNIPENFYILRHNQRTKLNGESAKVIEDNGKTIYDTNDALWIACHKPVVNNSVVKRVDREIAYTGHYGNKLCQMEITCRRKELEEEDTLQFYKERIIKNVLNISKHIFKDKDLKQDSEPSYEW